MNLAFRALDDPTRRRILDLLGESERTAGELAAAFELGKPTVSHHLAVLRRAGLVAARKESQTVRYRLETAVLFECLAWFMDLMRRDKRQSVAPPPVPPPEPAAPARRRRANVAGRASRLP